MSVTTTREHESPSGLATNARAVTSDKVGIASNGDFYIAVERVRFGFRCPFEEKTYEYSTAVSFANSGWLYGNYAMIGWLLRDHPVGLANMTNRDKNPISGVVFKLGAKRQLTATITLEASNFEWVVNRAKVPLIFSGRMSDVVPVEGSIS